MKPYIIIPVILGAIHVGYIITAMISSWLNSTVKKQKETASEYSIEHIVCFKNESKFIKRKLENTYSLDNPNIHNTFVNDNSSDDTLALLNNYKGQNTSIVTNEESMGKNSSQIKAVEQSKSDFLLFTDANVFLTKDSIDRLICTFDNDVGGVSGNVTITIDMKNQDVSGKYWQLEKMLKKFQSKAGAMIGFDGGFYCVKRENYNLTRENELSDFETAFLIFEQQKGCVFNSEATATELEKRKIKDSFKARMRASNRVFWSYYRIFKYIHGLPKSVLTHFILHKLIRYLFIISFVFSLPLIIINLVGITPWLLVLFLIPYISRFVIESVALCVGGFIALTGKEYTVWSQKKV